MIQVRILENGNPLPIHLEQYKAYASVPDDSRDEMLYGILRRAMLAVQEASDVAMLPCRLELRITDVHAGDVIRLYQGGATVVSVTGVDGTAVTDYIQNGNLIVLPYGCRQATVVYDNEVILAEAERLTPVVWELATAIYDGEDAKAQAQILAKTYGR